MKVPFLDLVVQYQSIRYEIAAAIQRVLDRAAYAGGPFVTQFENEFAAYSNCRHAIGVGSGTEALWFALLALDIGEGDEVITVPNTFIATAEAISFAGAKPVFIDIDEKTYAMNPKLIEGAITSRTKAIIPVHLFGQMADMASILEVANKHGLFVVEDAAQAHGAQYRGEMAGSIGNAGCFSFYPGKNLGAYGEAGAVTTNDDELADKVRILRDHGQKIKYFHKLIGWNGRMDGIQGAILSVKLKYLSEWTNQRRNVASTYNDLLKDLGDSLVLPFEADYAHHVYHIYAVRAKERDALMASLAEKDISCGIHYPHPVHLQEAYSRLGLAEGELSVAEQCAKELVSLPMFPELTEEQVNYVANHVKEFY